jgi:hypothetical protein
MTILPPSLYHPYRWHIDVLVSSSRGDRTGTPSGTCGDRITDEAIEAWKPAVENEAAALA